MASLAHSVASPSAKVIASLLITRSTASNIRISIRWTKRCLLSNTTRATHARPSGWTTQPKMRLGLMDCQRMVAGDDTGGWSGGRGGGLPEICAGAPRRAVGSSSNPKVSFRGVCLASEPLRGPSQRQLCPALTTPPSAITSALLRGIFLTSKKRRLSPFQN